MREICFLFERQEPVGTRDEREFTGTGFFTYFMINYHDDRSGLRRMALSKSMPLFNAEKGSS
jgi:squalene cyclase